MFKPTNQRNEHKLEDDISSPKTVDVQSLDIGQNNCATFSRDRTNEKANAFVSRKQKTIKETIVQIRKACHARIFVDASRNW
jgi:hypothetical protein